MDRYEHMIARADCKNDFSRPDQLLAKPSGWWKGLENAIMRPLAHGRGDTTTSTGRNVALVLLILI